MGWTEADGGARNISGVSSESDLSKSLYCMLCTHTPRSSYQCLAGTRPHHQAGSDKTLHNIHINEVRDVMRGEEAGGGAAAMNIEAEGSALLSTTEVNRTFVFQQLRQTVEQLRGEGAIR